MSWAKLLQWIAAISLAVAALILYRPNVGANARVNLRGYELFAVAESLVHNHSFADPFLPMPTGPTAHVGPVYPAYLALVFIVFGHGSTAVAVLMWGALLIVALQLAMLPFLARRLQLGFWTGVLAAVGWLAAGIPPTVLSEATFTSLIVIAALFLMAKCFAEELPARDVILWAVLWATLLLLQTVVLLVLGVYVVLLHFRSQRSARQKLALGMLPLLLVTPWIARDFLAFHKLFFIRDNLGIEMAVSNNPCATALFATNIENGCFATTHPNQSFAEALKVREMGEVEYNRLRLNEAIDWIRANPRAFAALSMQRFEAFWNPPVSTHPREGVILRPWVLLCFTLLSIPGMFIMWKNAPYSAYVVALWLVFFPPTYYLIQFMMRYRYPILWATFVPGSYFIVELLKGIAGKKTSASTATQVSTGKEQTTVAREL